MDRRQNNLKSAFSSFIWSKIFIFFCFILPPLALYFIEVTNTVLSVYLGGLTSISMFAYLLITKTSISALGINCKKKSISRIFPQTIAVAVLIIFILGIAPWIARSPRTLYWQINPFWYLLIVIYQEIIWRSFADLLLRKIYSNNEKLVIFTSAIFFAIAHLYFKSLLIVLGSFLLGLFWAKQYADSRSILGVTVSHFCLGIIIIALNYMGIKPQWSLF